MRSLILLVAAFVLAHVMWFVALLCIAHQAFDMPVTHADYQKCVTVKTAPLDKRDKPDLYPNNSDLS